MANETSASHATAVSAASPAPGRTDGATRDTERERERELVVRAQAGDQRAIRALYLLHANTVFRCAIMPLIRDRNLAEDLLADTFVRAIENLHRFTWQGKGLLPWLIRIGKNLCLDHLRKAGRTTAWPEGFEQQIPDLSDSNAESLLGRAELSDLLRERISTCMTDLNPRYRRVLELRMIEKRSRQDAASELDVTIGTLDVLLFRACKSFRKVYARHYGEGGEGPEFTSA
ncbi:RNA polymerase sigma factor SigM [Enhygromyxa salina]|uniref:RNA polymerase sigma factor SigM n=1 Tax=Enhygromyxa salina TaxID=215803 RepID=A0A2S9YCT1_9BACT|nr:RNA polymerase sigma factor [Enhygromyxa salina]PRQ02927.1 RNA polymerase sigma factor SigM [Enhygromyxa salina]